MQDSINNNYPIVTVVTATYKKFDYLYETIKSVFLQDYPYIEYIICDDGSENFPKEEIQKYINENKKENIVDSKIFTSDVNRGTVKNLNHAYKNSHGDIVMNLSCGDVFFSKHVIAKIVSVFKKTNCNVLVASRVLYTGNYEPICFLPHYQERQIIRKLDTPLKQYSALITSRYYDMASGSAMYFSRKILEEIGYFDEKYVLWEDGPFLAKYLHKYKLEYAYEIVSIWYQYGGMSTNKSKPLNPILRKDSDKFNCGERLNYLNKLSFSDQRLVRFNRMFPACNSFDEKIKLILKFIPEFIMNRLYQFRRKRNSRNDKKYLDKLLINQNGIIGYNKK